MKIIFLSNTCWSLYNFRYDLIKNISKNHDVYILAKLDNTKNKFYEIGCTCIDINFDQRGINLFREFITTFELFYKIFKIKPNIIFSFTIKCIIYSGFLRFFKNFKLICTLDGLGSIMLRRKIFKKLIFFLVKLSQFKTSYFLFVSKNDFNFFKKNNLISLNCKRMIIPGTGINTKFFKYKRINLNKITFTFIGRFLKSKGIIEFVNSSIFLKKKYPYVNFTAIGKIDYYDKYSLSAKELEELKSFKVVNFKDYVDDVRPIIIDTTCVVLPTFYSEGIPRSLLESLSIGRLIITTNLGGCNELVLENYNGYLCKPQNEIDLINQMTKVIKMNSKNKFNFSINSRKLSYKKFSIDRIIQLYEKFTK